MRSNRMLRLKYYKGCTTIPRRIFRAKPGFPFDRWKKKVRWLKRSYGNHSPAIVATRWDRTFSDRCRCYRYDCREWLPYDRNDRCFFQWSYGNRALGCPAKIKMTTEPANTEDPGHATSTEISRPSAPAKAHIPQSSQHRPFPLHS